MHVYISGCLCWRSSLNIACVRCLTSSPGFSLRLLPSTFLCSAWWEFLLLRVFPPRNLKLNEGNLKLDSFLDFPWLSCQASQVRSAFRKKMSVNFKVSMKQQSRYFTLMILWILKCETIYFWKNVNNY